MAEVSSQTLHIVARELASEMNEARASLEAFGEQQENLALLRKCNEHLHSVHGALRVAEVYGAALLAEEMGQVAGYLIANFAEKRHLAEGLDALMRAMVQLPTYLERVLSGGRDMALVLLPLLNDLRAVRGHALLSEGTLLLLNLSSDQQANPTAGRPGEAALTVAQWARKLRTRFQLGLLGWIKGERIDQNLEVLSRAAEKLEHVATTQSVFQLWWVAGAVLEALREGGLEGSASIKRLLGQADREMKRLYEQGEARYADSPPLELLNNLLYYVARARSTGPRVAAVRASFRLTELLPVDDSVEQARESLSAPSVKLMKTVAAAIKEDLGRVKDALDIFVRQGGTQVDELAPQLELLKKIADTLGVLGLGELRDKVQTETADLQSIVTQRSSASEGTLLRMAATLIKVEDSLDEQLVGMIVPIATEAGEAPSKPAGPDEIEFRQVTEAVLRECIVNMARIKEAVAHSFEKPREAQAIDQIPQLVRGITAGLLMLGKTRVVEIMEGIDRALAQFVRGDGMTLPQEAVDRLADAIVAVEYYMETIQAGRADPWYMLDNAESCLRFLAEAQPVPRIEAYGGTTSDHARTVVIETTAQTVALATEHEPTAILDPVTQQVQRPPKSIKPVAVPPHAPPPALAKPVDREIDPEFLELFIEEAKDEIAKLKQLFPMWDENPQDLDALTNVRRSFHTLKGSGRMVGAQLIGEFAWAVENMLNRVINKTLDRTPDMMTVLRSAVAAVPELVEQLETGRNPQVDIARIIATANTMAGVRPGNAPAPAQTPLVVRRAPEPPVLTVPASPPPAEKKTAPAPSANPVAPPHSPLPSQAARPAVSSNPAQPFHQEAASRQPAPPPLRRDPPPEPPMDPGLHEIYAKETAGHLATIREFIAACALANAPYPVTEDLHRSCHTLSGTAKTAGARQGIKIAEPLNRYIRKLYDNSVGLPEAGLSVLKEAITAIQQVVDNITEDTGFFANHTQIVARLTQLEHALDSELSRLAEAIDITSANAALTATSADIDEPTLVPIQENVLVAESVLDAQAHEAQTIQSPVLEPVMLEPTAEQEEVLLSADEASTLASEPPSLSDETIEVIELEITDAKALDQLSWSYQNFPPGSPAASGAETAEGEAIVLSSDEGEAIVLEAPPDEVVIELSADTGMMVVEEGGDLDGLLVEEGSRSLLQLDGAPPDGIVIETAAWAAEFEPPVLPVEAAPALNLDDAETVRSLALSLPPGVSELSHAAEEAEPTEIKPVPIPELEALLDVAVPPVEAAQAGITHTQPETAQVDTAYAEGTQPGTAAEAAHAEGMQPETAWAGVARQEAAQAGVTWPEAAQVEASHDEAVHPEAVKAEAVQPEAEQADAVQVIEVTWEPQAELTPPAAGPEAPAESEPTVEVMAFAPAESDVALEPVAESEPTVEVVAFASPEAEVTLEWELASPEAEVALESALASPEAEVAPESAVASLESEVAPGSAFALPESEVAPQSAFAPREPGRAPEPVGELEAEMASLFAEPEPQIEHAAHAREPEMAGAQASVVERAAPPSAPEIAAVHAPVVEDIAPPAVASPAVTPAPMLPMAASIASPPAAVEEDYPDDADFDPDVAAIFTEEATELLETADSSLSSWIRDRGNNALVFELKRVVHTLKGGARMAGIRSMGDLSHELETLMGMVESGQVPAQQQVFETLQSSLDELHRMRDIVANGDRAQPARELMNRLRVLCGQEPVPEPAVAAAVLAVAGVATAPPVATAGAAAPLADIASAAVPELDTPAAVEPQPIDLVDYAVEAPVDDAAVEPAAAAVAADEPEVIEYQHDEQTSSETDIVPMLTEHVRDAAAAPAAEPEEAVDADIDVEFGADELGAAAPREAVRVEQANATAATGQHPALDVAALAPDLPPDASTDEESPVEPQAPALPGRERQQVQEKQEFARVDADLLDTLLNNAGEVSIFRSRLEQQVSSIEFNLAELGRTVTRLKEQLRKFELETEAQILHRHEDDKPNRSDFDPLELDRYSMIQQLSRAFAESVSDVSSIEGLLENLTREAQNLLLQQSRVVTEMQNGLMRTRMVPFQRHVQRLSRLVRQVATDTGKRCELVVIGASGELDRQVLERMLPPFEHMLRNSVVHGIEMPDERVAHGKPASGTIKVGLHREGSEMVIVLEDDGRGIDVNAVRERARSRGLLQPGRVLSDEEAMQLILEPGFSTASSITQHAGRGVGMDVVVNEIKKLGGALFTQSQPGQGVKFTVRLPFTLAIAQALIVRTGEELYALPLPSVEGVARIPRSEVQRHLAEESPTFTYGGQVYRLQHLGAFIGGGPSVLPEADVSVPLILIRAGDHSTAIITDELVGSREMVVKSVGPQIATIRGIAGATILGDGRIVIILDMHALARADQQRARTIEDQGPKQDKRTFALVVDDSITVRRVTQRLLERNGMRVMTAKDGVDALSILQDHVPDVILLDIEMPRMDGYELATHVRADARLTDIPIVMITSRVGEKHRARAIEIGVNDYLGKPYQENQLLDAIEPLVQARRRKVGNA